jgi:N-acyl-D-amino-acid deacylase
MARFDVLLRGGLLVDGSGAPARPADVGLLGDRILAVGDLSGVEVEGADLVLDVTGRVVAPGFVDPHGHSDASVLVDGTLVSHLRQGYTTQLSGNCGLALAPLTRLSRRFVELELRPHAVVARWESFADYLGAVERVPLGPNVAFLAGHGTLRAAVLGADAAEPAPEALAAMIRHLEEALDAGAFGLSSGLIYAPGMHATRAELEALVSVTARHGGLYATHLRNEAGGLFDALDEALGTIRAAGEGARLQVSHLKAGARSVWGRAGEAIERLERARASGLDVGADQYPYTAAATSLTILLPPSLLALGLDESIAVLSDRDARGRLVREMEAGRSGWENVAIDPGWSGIRISHSPGHAEWAGRTLDDIAADLGRDPADVACDILLDDRLATSIVLDAANEDDVRAILATSWIGVCTDAEGRRAGHPILGAGVPHPRTYGTTARVLGHYVRDARVLSLETAVAKLSAIPAARLGLRDRGILREGACADVVVFDPATVLDPATYDAPGRYAEGIEHVFVNGRPAVLGGEESRERPGRLLRRGNA